MSNLSKTWLVMIVLIPLGYFGIKGIVMNPYESLALFAIATVVAWVVWLEWRTRR